MIFAANVLLLTLLSFLPGNEARSPDPHGLHRFAEDPALREMLKDGRVEEFEAAVEGFVFMRASIDLKHRASSSAVGSAVASRVDLSSLLGAIQQAMKVAAMAAELKALGPAKGMLKAVSWVESGLVRRSGLKAADFPSLFGIVSEPGRAAYDASQGDSIARDLAGSRAKMDTSYFSLLGRLREHAF